MRLPAGAHRIAAAAAAAIGLVVCGGLEGGANAGEPTLITGLGDLSVLRAVGAAPYGLRPVGPAATVKDSDFIDFIAFVGAAALSPSDRDQIVGAVHETLRRRPSDLQKADACIQTFFIVLPSREAFEKAADREGLRYALERLPADDAARTVLDRIDPVVVMDAAHKRIVTAATLDAWQRADAWAAGLLSAPGPRDDFIANERTFLKANFSALSAERADAIEHVERNRYATEVVLNEAAPTKRARYLRESRPLALDAAQFPTRLADTMEQAYEVLVKRRVPYPCVDVGQPGSPSLTPNLKAACDH